MLAANMRNAGLHGGGAEQLDWGTVLARRAKRDGWSIFPVYSNGIDMASPLNHFYIANNCADYPGWSCDAGIDGLLQDSRAGGRRRSAAADRRTHPGQGLRPRAQRDVGPVRPPGRLSLAAAQPDPVELPGMFWQVEV
ncbi:hypothetical protein [Dankookia sp. P2]|uniref:hypothetical protein n=1 Tax=Dankookia sp. P2 TaxID=3423955 RepID=UPI003D66C361